MRLSRLAPIDGETILPLADAKMHLRVTHDDEEALIASLRDAACEHVERVSGVALASADYRWEGSSFAQLSVLPLRPVTALIEAQYLDADGATQTYDGARLIGGAVYPAVNETWPVASGLASITFAAGDDCPPDLLAAVKLLLGHFYANRETVVIGSISSELPMSVAALIETHRKVLV